MKTLVADASAIGELLVRGDVDAAQRLLAPGEADVHVPELCDVEFLAALRRLLRRGLVDHTHGLELLDIYRQLPLRRHSHIDLMPRALGLRNNFTMTDAMYVVLAELLEAQLVTADQALARAAAAHTSIVVEQLY